MSFVLFEFVAAECVGILFINRIYILYMRWSRTDYIGLN